MDLVRMIMRGGYFKRNSQISSERSLQRISQRGGDPAGDLKIYQDIVDNYIGVQTKLFNELTKNLKTKIINNDDSEGKQAVEWLNETGEIDALKKNISPNNTREAIVGVARYE